MSNLVQRILVAAIGIPIVIYLCFKPFSLLGLSIICALLAVHEFYGLAKAKGFVPQIGIGMLFTALIVVCFAPFRIIQVITYFHLHGQMEATSLLPLVLILAVIVTLIAELFKGYPNPFVQISTTIAGACYVGVGLGGFFGVNEYFYLHPISASAAANPESIHIAAGLFTITTLASIWICDTAAFAVGRKIGKHKIAPSISPNKSWEGGISGVIAAIATWFIAQSVIPSLAELSFVTLIVMGIIAGVFGQVGDFAESLLKRDAGVKDSSSLIPGHGGVLDRLDSILFVFPIAYLYLHIFGA